MLPLSLVFNEHVTVDANICITPVANISGVFAAVDVTVDSIVLPLMSTCMLPLMFPLTLRLIFYRYH